MTEPIKTPQQILLDAANLLEERGWCQDEFQNKQGQMCMLGAMRVALWDKVIYPAHPAYGLACDATGMNGMKIAEWNDTPGRTQQEVISKLREAAQRIGDNDASR